MIPGERHMECAYNFDFFRLCVRGYPMRIVSLLPSATEIICQLGLREHLVGVTHECDYPPSVVGLPKVTSTLIPHDATSNQIDALVRERLKTEKALYTLNIPVLQSLRPDWIVTQALCDVCAVAESEVKQAVCSLPGNTQVINLEPVSLDDVLQCMRQVANAVDCSETAHREIQLLQARVQAVANRTQSLAERPSVMLLEWIDPPFCAGHWNPELVELAGGREIIGFKNQPSRSVSWETIVDADPEVLFIACCGFEIERTLQDLPLLQSYPGWESLQCVRNRKVFVVDGSAYFNRPGPRLVDSLEILANALHPEMHPLPDGIRPALMPLN